MGWGAELGALGVFQAIVSWSSGGGAGGEDAEGQVISVGLGIAW